jgi:DNA excision repair protein ERCC-4
VPARSSDVRATIVVDTREQAPYGFESPKVTSVRRALRAGDYSVEGLETVVAVERKTLDDFVSTVIWSRDRFQRELDRLRTYAAACVVVEADLTDVLKGSYWSEARPASVLGAAIAIIVDSGVPIFFCSDRQAARLFVERYLLRCSKRFSSRGQPASERTHGLVPMDACGRPDVRSEAVSATDSSTSHKGLGAGRGDVDP